MFDHKAHGLSVGETDRTPEEDDNLLVAVDDEDAVWTDSLGHCACGG